MAQSDQETKDQMMLNLATISFLLVTGQASPRVRVVLSGPARVTPGGNARFEIDVRNDSPKPVVLCKYPRSVFVVPADSSRLAFDPDPYDVRAELGSDWVVLAPGKTLKIHWLGRAESKARGRALLYAMLETPRTSEVNRKLRARVQAILKSSGGRLIPDSVRSANFLRVEFAN